MFKGKGVKTKKRGHDFKFTPLPYYPLCYAEDNSKIQKNLHLLFISLESTLYNYVHPQKEVSISN